jgi:hypothetical protein
MKFRLDIKIKTIICFSANRLCPAWAWQRRFLFFGEMVWRLQRQSERVHLPLLKELFIVYCEGHFRVLQLIKSCGSLQQRPFQSLKNVRQFRCVDLLYFQVINRLVILRACHSGGEATSGLQSVMIRLIPIKRYSGKTLLNP